MGMGASCQSRFTDALVPGPLCGRYAIGGAPGKGSGLGCVQQLQATASRSLRTATTLTNSLVEDLFEGGAGVELVSRWPQDSAVANVPRKGRARFLHNEGGVGMIRPHPVKPRPFSLDSEQP